MRTQTPKINAKSLDDVLQDESVTVFAIIGATMCGKTHLADALVRRLRDIRAPCFPIFIDEPDRSTMPLVTTAIQSSTSGRPVVIGRLLI